MLIGFVALAATLVLHYLNAAKFPILGTTAAIVVYLGATWSINAALVRYCGNTESRLMRSELLGSFVLIVVGLIAGGLGGAVWWLAVGPEIASLGQALAGGAMMGGFAILFLLGGP